MTVYEKEIFCLLGHNGAGKTTFVNMLTGLIPKTDGSFFYNGEEIQNSLEQLRKKIGFCPQKDFLLMDNTLYENLAFFAGIKEIPAAEIEAEVERVMNKFELQPLKNTLAKNLSGGFKRKLNIAIALLCNPKIIIMDEPTSGMDPVSRRNFWKIIKNLKEEEKTIILTTQFLDEAEELADRLGIMAKGKMFAIGSTDFIKKKFGIGYNLILHNNNNASDIQDQAPIINSLVHTIIPSSFRQNETNPTELHYVLPFNEQDKFSILFNELEKINDLQIGLQMVSLEEVFVSLGMNADEAFHNDQVEERLDSSRTSNIPASFTREKKPTFQNQLCSVLLQRLYHIQRDRLLIFFSIFPVLFIAGGVVLGGMIPEKKTAISLLISMILTGNALIMGTFIYPVASDRLSKIMFILKAMGLRSSSYWLANLISDFILKIIMTLIIILTISLCQVDFLQNELGSFVALYLSFAFNLITLAYKTSLMGQNKETLTALSVALVLGGYSIPLILHSILALFGVKILTYLYILSFLFLGPGALLHLGLNSIVPEEFADPNFVEFAPFKQTWLYICALLAMGVFQFLTLLYKDSKISELKEKKVYQSNTNSNAPPSLNDEILVEKDRINSQENKDLIKAFEVQKVYPNGFKALHDLSFGVEKEQVFCLLGPNGAGKTTAFEIITGAIPKTSGTVQLYGQNLSRDISEIFYNTGVASQSNTLWEYLTVEQHLRIFAKMKGMDQAETNEVIEYLLKSLQLEDHAKKSADELSGGNKRKLCVALAMIGGPKLLFLDEPSTGMDPVARKSLWILIKEAMKTSKGAMVLTTHYMQEAELIGDKIGILVNGQFETIGRMSELKKKFGEYSIIIQQSQDGLSRNELKNLIESIVPEAKLTNGEEEKEKEALFKIPAQNMKFSQLFKCLEEAKSKNEIKDFSLFTSSLEQIFIQLAKKQKDTKE